MKLWVDDLRPPPDDTWHWVVSSDEAIRCLQDNCVAAISLDHDLGGPDTTRPVVTWMATEDHWPKIIFVHTMNSVGREWLMGTCNRYAPLESQVAYRRSDQW